MTKDQKIAAFGSSYAPEGAAEGCVLLTLKKTDHEGRFFL
jgi:hypothetical protein